MTNRTKRRRRPTLKFYQELYEPLLVQAGRKDVLLKRMQRENAYKNLNTPQGIAHRKEAVVKGRKAYWDALPPEKKKELIMYLNAARARAMSPAARRASAAHAGKQAWKNVTPEKRSEHGRRAAQARWMQRKRWPFPERSE